MKPIIFIFGPSGVGKSHLSDLIKKQNFLFMQIDTDNAKRTFVANGFPSEWDNDFSRVRFDVFVDELRERITNKHDGAIVSFPIAYKFTKNNLNFLRQLEVVPVLLWGSEENCKQAARIRINKKGKPFNLDRYNQKNLQAFQLYGQSEFDAFRLEVFDANGGRFSDEELKKKFTDFMNKLKN